MPDSVAPIPCEDCGKEMSDLRAIFFVVCSECFEKNIAAWLVGKLKPRPKKP